MKKSRTFSGIGTITLALLITQQVEPASDTCNIPKCLQEAAKIIDYVDTKANPCENFYQFACGNFLRNSKENNKLTLWDKLKNRASYESLEIYKEGIHDGDHKMVKAAKKFFRACNNKTLIKEDFVKTMKKTLQAIGGWPVVDGANWNEKKFNLLKATYDLRRMGYEFSTFLNVGVEKDFNSGNNILRILQEKHHYAFIDDVGKIAKIAVLLGANNEKQVINELTNAYNAFEDLRKQVNPTYTNQTIEEVQKNNGIFNWLEFINKMIGPKVQVSSTDYIQVSNQDFKDRVQLIAKVPKRSQANYLIWEVIKSVYSFVENSEINRDNQEALQKNCLLATTNAYTTSVPNPLEIMRLRKYLPREKKASVEKMVQKIQSASKEALNNIEWISGDTKAKYLKRMGETKIIVGLSVDYFDDKLLNEADVDMIDIADDNSFFSLLAQATRNRQSSKYTTLKKTSPDLLEGSEAVLLHVPRFGADHIYLPSVLTGDLLFDETRPDYLNYGSLGIQISNYLWEQILGEIEDNKVDIKRCVFSNMHEVKLKQRDKTLSVYEAIRMSVGDQISRRAYEERVKENGVEPKLIATEYTPNQAFWISAISYTCEPAGPSNLKNDSVTESLRLSPSFAQDFNCGANSRLNPSTRCKIL